MKALVIGSGGREHALVHTLAQDASLELFWTPGNGGSEGLAADPGIMADDYAGLADFAHRETIDLTVVGPELPLVNGIVDLFRERDLRIFGPSAEGARIEGSKSYAKKLMKSMSIPTARSAEFTDEKEALAHIASIGVPIVVKADGLAAGKGVVVARTVEEAREAVGAMLSGAIGESGSRVVIEEFLEGEEATVLALCDGKRVLPLISSQDHKPAFDGDLGPNTGGMGAIAPAPVVETPVMGRVIDTVLMPLVEGLRNEGIDYRGVIYAGLMIRDGMPSVVEFNCRFGDPEAEAVLPLLDSSLFDALYAASEGDLEGITLSWRSGFACDVVLASGGYPGRYEKHKIISGMDKLREREDVLVFHAGTMRDGGSVVTNGGRVLNVVGLGNTLKTAVDRAYGGAEEIGFDGMHFRRDIGFRGLRRCGSAPSERGKPASAP